MNIKFYEFVGENFKLVGFGVKSIKIGFLRKKFYLKMLVFVKNLVYKKRLHNKRLFNKTLKFY